MLVQVLGADGGIVKNQTLTASFLIHGTIAVDAGSVASALSIQEQQKVTTVLLTHVHLDHIRELGFLAINRLGDTPPLSIYGSKGMLKELKSSLFNDRIWPDLTTRPKPEIASVKLVPIKAEREFEIEDLRVTAVAVPHSFEAYAYLLSDKNGTIVISGDTGPTVRLWEMANAAKNLKGVFLETSFPKQYSKLAENTHHISTANVCAEIKKIKAEVSVFLYHLKPPYQDQIETELKALECGNRLKVVHSGDYFDFSSL